MVMCTYNGERYLREQLDSIVNQTYPIYELLVQDDISTDSTMAILEQYAAKYPFIRYTRNTKNLGVAANFKSIFYQAKGDYIAIADQDDIWMLDKIQCMVDNIGDNLLISSCSYLLTKHNHLDINTISHQIPLNEYLELRYVALQSTMSGHDIMLSKQLLSYISPVIWKNYWYDFCLAITSIGLGKAAYINKYLTLWRRHELAYTYSNETHKDSSMSTIIYALKLSLSHKKRCLLGQFYKPLLSSLQGNEIAYRFAYKITKGSIFRVCLYTFMHRASFVDSNLGYVRSCLRSLLIPVLVYRNIENWNGMYIND